MSHATPSLLPDGSPSATRSNRSSTPGPAAWGRPRLWVVGALVSYAAAVLWAFVVWPLQHLDGLFFYYYQGLRTTIELFAPLVLLAICSLTRGRARAVSLAVAFVDLVWQLLPAQSGYLRFENAVAAALHVLALALCAVAGLVTLWPLVRGLRTTRVARPVGGWDALRVRRAGSLVLAAAGVAVFLGMAPTHSTSHSDIDAVMIDDSINQGRTEGAPQQAVVNGWTARDLLKIMATEGVESRDERPAAFAGLGLLALLLYIGTSETGRRGATDSRPLTTPAAGPTGQTTPTSSEVPYSYPGG